MNLDTLARLHAEGARNTVTDAQLPPIERIVRVRGSGKLVAALAGDGGSRCRSRRNCPVGWPGT